MQSLYQSGISIDDAPKIGQSLGPNPPIGYTFSDLSLLCPSMFSLAYSFSLSQSPIDSCKIELKLLILFPISSHEVCEVLRSSFALILEDYNHIFWMILH